MLLLCPIYTELTELVVPEGVTEIGKSALNECEGVRRITLPQSLRKIDDFAFGFTCIEEFVIPDGVTTIGHSAFNGADMRRAVLPESLREIGFCCFTQCWNLEEMVIPESNPFLYTENGMLFAFDGMTLLEQEGEVVEADGPVLLACFRSGYEEELVIPTGVKTIGDSALICSGYWRVVLPDTVNTIMDGAFAACQELKEMVIPASVTQIGEYAFTHCDSLSRIEGTKGSLAEETAKALGAAFAPIAQ